MRFSGCNLRCPFCDTQHASFTTLSEEQIVAEVRRYPAQWVVLTGGEPSLQITPTLLERLHAADRSIAIETNGTHPLPPGLDWITLSPKEGGTVCLQQVDELKALYDGIHPPLVPAGVAASCYSLQPIATADPIRNAETTKRCVDYCLAHPQWHLSLQLHKILNIR